KRVSLPMERVFVNVDRYGNTGAASVYVALEEALAGGRIKKGDLILLAAFGGGFAWGTALLRWGELSRFCSPGKARRPSGWARRATAPPRAPPRCSAAPTARPAS